nr:hypothetical protein [Tanacetum cinerariifolium]
MTLETHKWLSSAHQELLSIIKDEIFPIVKQVDARVQNFEIQFLKEAAKFVGDFKSLAKEADESLAKHKALELEIERLLKAVVSQDIMSIVQKASVVDTSNLQTKLDRTKELTEKHLKEVKRIFRYLWRTVNTGLWYTKDFGFDLAGFSDADYAECKETFKSTSGGAQFLGEKLLTDYGFHFKKISIYCDSKSAIAISCNPVQNSRTKHIAVRYHFIKEHVEMGIIELYFVKTDYQPADLFTKALPADRFNYLVRRLCMRSLSPQELDRLAKSQ